MRVRVTALRRAGPRFHDRGQESVDGFLRVHSTMHGEQAHKVARLCPGSGAPKEADLLPMLFEPEYMEAQQKAYHETAIEDEEICVRMTEGRRALLADGREEHGPYQSPMEDGMVHFHEFIQREIGQFV